MPQPMREFPARLQASSSSFGFKSCMKTELTRPATARPSLWRASPLRVGLCLCRCSCSTSALILVQVRRPSSPCLGRAGRPLRHESSGDNDRFDDAGRAKCYNGRVHFGQLATQPATRHLLPAARPILNVEYRMLTISPIPIAEYAEKCGTYIRTCVCMRIFDFASSGLSACLPGILPVESLQVFHRMRTVRPWPVTRLSTGQTKD